MFVDCYCKRMRSISTIALHAFLYIFLSQIAKAEKQPLLYVSCGVDNAVALTFDDGPEFPITGQILDVLGRNGVPATFFVCGYQLQSPENVALLRRAFAEGHVIGSHSYSHPDFIHLGDDGIKSEMRRTSRAIQDIIGVKPRLMRAPYGSLDYRVAHVLMKMHYKMIGWDVDSDDWKAHTSILDTIVHQMAGKRSALILMHDTHQRTADSLQSVIDYIRSLGKNFLTVDKCLNFSKAYRSRRCHRHH